MWLYALKADKPIETYQEMVAAKHQADSTPAVDELPKEQQDWLRATSDIPTPTPNISS